MKPTIRYLIPLVLVALAGCVHVPLEYETSDGEYTATLRFSVQGFDETKGLATDIVDDEVDVIDIFSWDDNDAIVGHSTIGEYGGTALDLSNITFTDRGFPSNKKRYYLIMANLDPDSSDYIATLNGSEVNGYPKGYIPWSAGNCRPSRPLMGATAAVDFSTSSRSASVSLMRYMSKFEIGSVDAQFWGTPDQFRNIYLSNIVFSNSWDIVRICQSNAKYFDGNPNNLFGPKGTSSQSLGNLSSLYYNANCFLGQNQWSSAGMTFYSLNGTYVPGDWGAGGKLDDAFDYLYNNNYMQPKNTICLDAPASLVPVSQQTSLGPFEVNKVFYTLPTCLYAYYSQPEYDPVNNQDVYHKLVIGVKINGTNYYYPMNLHNLQPNMCYRINTITLKGEPSEYPNVWPRGGVVSRAVTSEPKEVTENQWEVHGNVATIDNLVL